MSAGRRHKAERRGTVRQPKACTSLAEIRLSLVRPPVSSDGAPTAIRPSWRRSSSSCTTPGFVGAKSLDRGMPPRS